MQPPDLFLVGGAVALSVLLLGVAIVTTSRAIRLTPPFPPTHTIKLRAFNAMALPHMGWAPLLFTSTETHNFGFLMAVEVGTWAFVQLLLVPRYRAFWQAAREEVRAQKSPLQRAT